MPSPISQAIKQICEEKNISEASVIETIEAALAAAYRKDFGEKNQNTRATFDPETGATRVFDVKTVVEDMEIPEEGEEEKEGEGWGRGSLRPAAEAAPKAESGAAEPAGEEGPKWNPRTMIMISEAKKIKPDAEIGEEIRTELEIPGAFGRMAAQTAKQVIMQKIREAERAVIFADFKGKEGEVLIATVQRREGRVVLFDVGRATAVMPPEEQSPQEHYTPGERKKVYIASVTMTTKGPEIIVSRTRPELLRKLFAQEIPEVSSGAVELKSISREAGSRSKVAVATEEESIDPIGSCIGQRGTRIQTIIAELGGEKIDVIAWDSRSEAFIANALSPAKVISVTADEKTRTATVQVAPDQLSLAIGRGGQNVRLAARLTGWNITVSGAGAKEAAVEAEAGAAEEAAAEASAEAGESGAAEEKEVGDKQDEKGPSDAEETKDPGQSAETPASQEKPPETPS